MEILIETISQLWEELDNTYVPLLEVPFTQFFTALVIVNALIFMINIIIGKTVDRGDHDK